ncbi:MAG: hypothetical protein WDM94_09390 [Bauldia sp.]
MPIFLPLKVEAGAPILRGVDFLWCQIRAAGKNGREFTAAEIDLAGNDPHRRSVTAFLGRLVKAGIVAATGWKEPSSPRLRRGMSVPRTYKLVKRPIETPRLNRDGTASPNGRDRLQAMWNAMRALSTFDARELAVAATTEEVRVTAGYASQYASALLAAGYLLPVDPAAKWRRTYRLKPSGNTGPRAPRMLVARVIYDPNRKKVAGPVVADEVGL